MVNMSSQSENLEDTGSRFFVLLLLILIMILAGPFLDPFIGLRFITDIFFSAILLSTLFIISRNIYYLIIGSLLVLPELASIWFEYYEVSPWFYAVGDIFGTLFFAVAVYGILKFILNSKMVTKDVIFASIVVYLLLALLWGIAYAALEYFIPGSFSIPDTDGRETKYSFFYFSFVTITTLGFGDIVPLTKRASALTIVEAVIGQIYLVVLVAWLVGMHVSEKFGQKQK